jgi:acyl carrier protein
LGVTSQDVQQFVFEAIESFGPEVEAINREATLESLDVDSLDLVELGQMVEERYSVRLGADDLSEVRTVGQAIDMIAEKIP